MLCLIGTNNGGGPAKHIKHTYFHTVMVYPHQHREHCCHSYHCKHICAHVYAYTISAVINIVPIIITIVFSITSSTIGIIITITTAVIIPITTC